MSLKLHENLTNERGLLKLLSVELLSQSLLWTNRGEFDPRESLEFELDETPWNNPVEIPWRILPRWEQWRSSTGTSARASSLSSSPPSPSALSPSPSHSMCMQEAFSAWIIKNFFNNLTLIPTSSISSPHHYHHHEPYLRSNKGVISQRVSSSSLPPCILRGK